MFVSRLELLGFKSFAQRTVLLFPEGLTAIVGPNGCGKSNIVDALRWVLGEQRLSVLRCETLEQLIFNGSRALKPSGMAEVTLTVENTSGVLPVEFTHVVVTRRVYRNGESEYRLNGTPCRLRDIQELFLDSGFAAHSYSVIELRMVEELLNGRPEERRRLLEEAAGIGKYKLRRREAQRKLESVRHDLERIETLLAELRQQAAALSQQAEQARQWQQWDAQRRHAERLLLACHWHRLGEQLQESQQRAQHHRHQLQQVEQRAEELRAALRAEEEASAAVEHALSQLDAHLRQLTEELHPLRVRCETVRERQRIAQESATRLVREQERIRQELLQLAQQREEVRCRFEEVHQQEQHWRERLNQIQHRQEELRQALQRCQRSLQPQRQHIEMQRQRVFHCRLELECLQARRELVLRHIQQSHQERERLRQRQEELRGALHRTEAELQHWEQQSRVRQQQLHQCQERAAELGERLGKLHQHGEQLRREILTLSARREWLESLASEHELLPALRTAFPELEFSLLAEHALVPEPFRRAFAATVAGLGELPLADRVEHVGDSLLHRLPDSVPSGAVLFPSEAEPGRLPPLEKQPGVHGWLWELVVLPSPLAAALYALLGRVLVVDSLAVGMPFLEHGLADAVVTCDGLFLHRSGLFRWQRAVTPWIGRRHEQQELQRRLEQLHSELESIELQQAELRQQMQQVDPEPARQAYAEAERHLHRLQAQLGQLQQQMERLEQVWSELQQQLQQLQAEQAQLVERIGHLTQELQQAEEALRAAEERLAAELAEEERLRTALEEVSEEWHQTERHALAAHHERSQLERTLQELNRRLEQLRHRETQLQQERTEAEALLNRLQRELDTTTEQRQAWEAKLQELRQQQEQYRQRLQQHRQRYTDIAAQLQSLQQQRDEAFDRLHAAELRCEQLRTQRQELCERFRELFGEEPAAVELPQPLPPLSRLQQQIRQATQQLEALGPVNFRALQEYEQLCERLRFLESQHADLQQAALSLEQIAEETHRVAVQRFTETFEQVRRNFQRLFRLLFDEGDEADLRLSGEDPLEASVDIVAKPRGKRPQLLEQLSGGEKTLVAIAFLFALYLVKPSPFCVLDEIDAPLDDANIDRFLRLLRGFADTTQFLLITHNKRTMEAVDTLYGVTLQPDGVSKVVAVRLRPPEQVSP